MRLVFSKLAEQDLEGIADFIATGNPERALSFVRELRRRCTTLADRPQAHPLRQEFGKGVRLMVHKRYLILYRPENAEVRIERILQGARNIIALIHAASNP